MTVVDLDEARRVRAEARRLAGEIGATLADITLDQADRAFRVSGPVMSTDPSLARAVNRWVRRQLRRTAKTCMKGHITAIGLVHVMEQLDSLYRGRLLALEDEAVVSTPVKEN